MTDALTANEWAPRELATSDGKPNADRLIVLKTATGLRFDSTADVEWLEADCNYVLFHIRGERVRVRQTLSELEGILDPNRFLRISRTAIVNLAHAREAVALGSGQYAFEMRSGYRLLASRSRARVIRRLTASVRCW